MLINNYDIKTFNAKVENKMFNHVKDKETEKGALNIRLLFNGVNREDVHKNISDFMASNIEECVIKFKNSSNYFYASYMDHSIEETGFDEYLFIDIEFEYQEYGEEITHTFISQGTISVKGNTKCEAKLNITSRIDLIDCILEGVTEEPIKIENIKANKTVVLDGIEGLIIEEGKNKYLDIDLWEFPMLLPGKNLIKVNRENVNIEIKYRPKWR